MGGHMMNYKIYIMDVDLFVNYFLGKLCRLCFGYTNRIQYKGVWPLPQEKNMGFLGYDIKCHLMIKLLFCRFKECDERIRY